MIITVLPFVEIKGLYNTLWLFWAKIGLALMRLSCQTLEYKMVEIPIHSLVELYCFCMAGQHDVFWFLFSV